MKTTSKVGKVPKSFAVQPLKHGDNPPGKATCGHCGLSWDDDKVTSMTPAPSGRCPFETFHKYPEDKPVGREPQSHDDFADAAARHVLKKAPVDFDEIATNMTTEHRGEVTRELEAIAAGAAFAAAYFSARYGEGCGDQGHDYAVKCANRAKRMTRKAFGYDVTAEVRF